MRGESSYDRRVNTCTSVEPLRAVDGLHHGDSVVVTRVDLGVSGRTRELMGDALVAGKETT